MFDKRTRGEKFLDEQARRFNRAFERNNEKIQAQQDARDRAFAQAQDERDQRIKADLDSREWQRRNENHKKSVFYAELQQARIENRPSLYQSHMDVPDLEMPTPPRTLVSRLNAVLGTGFNLVLVLGIAIVAIVAAAITFWRMFGGFILQLVLVVLAAYGVMTVIWLVKRYGLNPQSPESVAAADRWNPKNNTVLVVKFFRQKLRGHKS